MTRSGIEPRPPAPRADVLYPLCYAGAVNWKPWPWNSTMNRIACFLVLSERQSPVLDWIHVHDPSRWSCQKKKSHSYLHLTRVGERDGIIPHSLPLPQKKEKKNILLCLVMRGGNLSPKLSFPSSGARYLTLCPFDNSWRN